MEDIIDFQPLFHTEDYIYNNKNKDKIKLDSKCLEFKTLYYSCMKEKNNDFKKCIEEYNTMIFCKQN